MQFKGCFLKETNNLHFWRVIQPLVQNKKEFLEIKQAENHIKLIQ